MLGAMAATKAEQLVAAPQLHDPAKCAETDNKCILEWYAEYKPAIIEALLSTAIQLGAPAIGIFLNCQAMTAGKTTRNTEPRGCAGAAESSPS